MTSRKKLVRLAWILPILWLLTLKPVPARCSTGYESETAVAQTDSLTTAFFLLKFDYDLLAARSEAKDALIEARISDLKADHLRQMYTIVATAVLTALLFLAGKSMD